MTNAELVLSYLSSFETGDRDVVARHVAEDFQNIQMTALGSGCEGKAIYRERLTDFLRDFENLQYKIDELIVDKAHIAVTYEMQFSQKGQRIKIPGVMVFKIRDGLIASRKDYWDGLSYQEQTAQ